MSTFWISVLIVAGVLLIIFVIQLIRAFNSPFCPKCSRIGKQIRQGVTPGDDNETVKCGHCGKTYYLPD